VTLASVRLALRRLARAQVGSSTNHRNPAVAARCDKVPLPSELPPFAGPPWGRSNASRRKPTSADHQYFGRIDAETILQGGLATALDQAQ